MRDFVTSQLKTHLQSLYRWGVLIDHKDIELTLDPNYIDSCLSAIQELVSENKIRLDYKPLFWSVKEGKVIPPSEIEVKEDYKKGYFVHFSAAEMGVTQTLKEGGNKLAMTYPGLTFIAHIEQPWQLAGVRALAIHPKRGYTVFYFQSKPYIMATRSLDNYKGTLFAHGKVQKVANYIGEQLVGVEVLDPLTGREIPVVATEDSEDTNTFIRTICPSTNPRDFILAEKLGLDKSPCTNVQGKIMSPNKRIDNLTVHETASDGVVLELAAQEKIGQYSEELHSAYYISKKTQEILAMLTVPEWVAEVSEAEIVRYCRDLSKVKNLALQGIEEFSLQNKLAQASRIVKLSGRHEHGIPLPFFRFKDNPLKFFLSPKQIEFLRKLFIEHGTKIWKEWPVSSLLHEDYLNMVDNLEKVDAVLDEGFEGGLFWHHYQNQVDKKKAPAEVDLLVEGADSVSEWLQDQAFSQAMLAGSPQFKELMIHPVCIDDEGERLSKRTHSQSADSLVYGALKLNNEVQYGMGAEVFRLWAASVTSDVPQTNTIVLIETFIDQKREELNLLRKILWQASVVLASSRDNVSMSKEAEDEKINRPLNKAIEAQYKFICASVTKFYQQRNLSGVYCIMVDFLKYHYLDMIMPYLVDNIKQRGDAFSYRTLSKIHRDTLLLLSPILPFSSEEAFHHSFDRSMYEAESYFLPGQAARAMGSDIEDLQNYRLVYDIKAKLIELQEKISHGESRKSRRRYDLLVLYPQKALEMRAQLDKLDLVELARFLDVKSIRLEQEDIQDLSNMDFSSRGTFKIKRCTFRLTVQTTSKSSSSKKNSDIEIF